MSHSLRFTRNDDYSQKLVDVKDIPRYKDDGYQVIDFHLHTTASYDVLPSSVVQPKNLYKEMMGNGWDYVTFTDHDTLDAFDLIDEASPNLIPGVEIKIKPLKIGSYKDAHTLHINVYCLTKRQFRDLEELAQKRDFYGFKAYLDEADLPYQLNHPTWTEIDDTPDWRFLPDIVREFDVIEVINHKRPQRHNLIALKHLAEAFGKGITAGSDSHIGEPEMATLCRGADFREIWENIKAGDSLVVRQADIPPINKGDILSRVEQIRELIVDSGNPVEFPNRLGDAPDKWVKLLLEMLNSSPLVVKRLHCAFLRGLAHVAGDMIIRKVYLNRQDQYANTIEFELNRKSSLEPAFFMNTSAEISVQ